MDINDNRDYAEEAYNAHTMHTGDGEVEFCEYPTCPYFVPECERYGQNWEIDTFDPERDDFLDWLLRD